MIFCRIASAPPSQLISQAGPWSTAYCTASATAWLAIWTDNVLLAVAPATELRPHVTAVGRGTSLRMLLPRAVKAAAEQESQAAAFATVPVAVPVPT